MENFSIGDVVDVRNYGRAEVIEPIVIDPQSRYRGRIRVKYQSDGKTYYARPESLRRTLQVKQRVLLCHSTKHYRTCAASVVNWGDAVLEVGSHEGECTFMLSRRCRYIVGVDKSRPTVEAARRRYPGLRFEEVDGFDVPALKALGPPDGSGFSVVLVDIGGIASLATVAGLVGLYYKEFPYTTKIVVKSVFLKRMVENCLPYNVEKSNPWALLSSSASNSTKGGGDGGSGDAIGNSGDGAVGTGPASGRAGKPVAEKGHEGEEDDDACSESEDGEDAEGGVGEIGGASGGSGVKIGDAGGGKPCGSSGEGAEAAVLTAEVGELCLGGEESTRAGEG